MSRCTWTLFFQLVDGSVRRASKTSEPYKSETLRFTSTRPLFGEIVCANIHGNVTLQFLPNETRLKKQSWAWISRLCCSRRRGEWRPSCRCGGCGPRSSHAWRPRNYNQLHSPVLASALQVLQRSATISLGRLQEHSTRSGQTIPMEKTPVSWTASGRSVECASAISHP